MDTARFPRRSCVTAGAISVTRPGAQPSMPDRQELLAMLER
jgi:sugar/nucleoside kinase (ribokinase family)